MPLIGLHTWGKTFRWKRVIFSQGTNCDDFCLWQQNSYLQRSQALVQNPLTRSGVRTHEDLRPLELKSNALTTRPSWSSHQLRHPEFSETYLLRQKRFFFYLKRTAKIRGQPELNRWPLDLQSNALPLSYTPSMTGFQHKSSQSSQKQWQVINILTMSRPWWSIPSDSKRTHHVPVTRQNSAPGEARTHNLRIASLTHLDEPIILTISTAR